jgi:hypothetical protein
MNFRTSKVARIIFAIPVLLVNIITLLNLAILHFGLLNHDLDPTESLVKSILIYFCVCTGMIAYSKAYTSDPGSIPFEFDMLSDSYKELLPDSEYGAIKKFVCVSFCHKCERSRPARSHHCIICGKCVMRQDHHCPWIGNCVGIFNTRYFLQFIFYALITTSVLNGTCCKLILDGQAKNFWITGGFFLTLGLFIMMWMLLTYHLWMITLNTNTIELTFHKDKSNFNFGWKTNLIEVLGQDWLAYFLPYNIKKKEGLGYVFPVKIENELGEIEYFNNKVLI